MLFRVVTTARSCACRPTQRMERARLHAATSIPSKKCTSGPRLFRGRQRERGEEGTGWQGLRRSGTLLVHHVLSAHTHTLPCLSRTRDWDVTLRAWVSPMAGESTEGLTAAAVERKIVVGETAVARVLTVSLEPAEEEGEDREKRRYHLTTRTELKLARPEYFWKVHAHARACFTYSYAVKNEGEGFSNVQSTEKTLGCSSALEAWARGDGASVTTAKHRFSFSIAVSEEAALAMLTVKVHIFSIVWEPLLAEGGARAVALF